MRRTGAGLHGLHVAAWGIAQLTLSACATFPVGTGPELVTGAPVTSVALLGTLHPSAPVRHHADSLLEQRLRTSCRSVTILTLDETAQRFAARRLVPPRQLAAGFAREAREVLGVDLLLAPMVLGLTYDTRNTVAGWVNAIAQPVESSSEDRAGIALEGWDLRSAERTVWIVRTHSSENSWTADPAALLRNAVFDAVQRVVPICARSAGA